MRPNAIFRPSDIEAANADVPVSTWGRRQLGFSWSIAFVVIVCLFVTKAFSQIPSPKISLVAEPFSLTEVRLLDGPFRDAMVRDQEYMLSLEPDRLLHNFRVNVGLPSTAKPLGGWENPKSELRGHTVGHYLSALSLMYASTGECGIQTACGLYCGRTRQVPEQFAGSGISRGLSFGISRIVY